MSPDKKRIIASSIPGNERLIDIEDVVEKHYDNIKRYGDKSGWPFYIGIVKTEDSYALADIEAPTNPNSLCKCMVNKDSEKSDIVKGLMGDISFLV